MPRPRKAQVNINQTPYYHCISRCVRRAYLCGEDKVDGKNYNHRKQWLVDRIHHLSSVFCVDICAYAVMSNHYHIVIFVDQYRAQRLTARDVLDRWTKIYRGPSIVQRYLEGNALSANERSVLSDLTETYRERLANLSWFMKALNEPIARDANFEDRCTGRFWEGRFKSYALLDEAAVLSAMTYVDLNPIRSNLANSLDESDFTSIQQRLFEYAEQLAESGQESTGNSDHNLHPFLDTEQRCKESPGLGYRSEDYFALVDWSGRVIRSDKRGSIPKHLPTLLNRIGLSSGQWTERIRIPHAKACKITKRAA